MRVTNSPPLRNLQDSANGSRASCDRRTRESQGTLDFPRQVSPQDDWRLAAFGLEQLSSDGARARSRWHQNCLHRYNLWEIAVLDASMLRLLASFSEKVRVYNTLVNAGMVVALRGSFVARRMPGFKCSNRHDLGFIAGTYRLEFSEMDRPGLSYGCIGCLFITSRTENISEGVEDICSLCCHCFLVSCFSLIHHQPLV